MKDLDFALTKRVL